MARWLRFSDELRIRVTSHNPPQERDLRMVRTLYSLTRGSTSSFEFWDMVHDGGPVFVQSGLEHVYSLSRDNWYWQRIPVLDNTDTKRVSPSPWDSVRLYQLPRMASSASLGADRKERIILLVDTPMDRYAERGRFRRDLVGAASGQTFNFKAAFGRTWGREGGIGAANNIWGKNRTPMPYKGGKKKKGNDY